MSFRDYEIAKNLKEFNENVFIEELMNSIDSFSEPIQLMINEALKHAVNKTDFFHIYEWLLEPKKWKMPKVSFDTFLDDEHYLGIKTERGAFVYKKIREIGRNIVEGGYAEAIILAGIGCERVGTKIIMADGSIKPNNEINEGDFLMGIDGTPRKVLQKHTGIDDMYELIPMKGDSKFVTKEHRLYLAKGLKRIIKRVGDIEFNHKNYELVYQNGTKTGILDIVSIGKEEFIGFEIDGDKLYMWDDFMITHNSGKSLLSQILACYLAHHLLCMRTPHKTYGLLPDKDLTIINMGLTATQALEIVFAGIRGFIEGSPFFLQFKPDIQQSNIRFKRELIRLTSGNSRVESSIGLNLFGAILDEAAFYLDNDNKNIAEEIFKSVCNRISSRLKGKGGLAIGISSPRYEGDFITKKIDEARELEANGKKKYASIYGIQMQSWKVKDLTPEELGTPFYFDPRKCIILEGTNLDKLKSEGRKINLIKDPDVSPNDDVWEIPQYLLTHFQKSPEGAKRDHGAIPSTSIAGYFSNPAKISGMFDRELINPVISPGKYRFLNKDGTIQRPLRTPYFIHIDIGFNRDGKGDHTGFAMGHFGGWEKDEISKEYRMRFVIDLVERIGITEDTGEVDLSDIRQRIYDLKDMGYFIKLITFDSFGCLTADTEIVTLDRGKVPIIDIRDGDWLIGCEEDGTIIPVQSKACRKTQSNAKIYKVLLDNGEYIKVTENHPFMLRNGKYKRVDELISGDSLMPYYNKISDYNSSGLEGYDMIKDNKSGKWEFTHKIIIDKLGIIKNKGMHIHYKDFNKLNNHPDNLEILTISEHSKKHSQDDKMLEKMKMMRDKLNSLPESIKKRNKALSETGKRLMSDPIFKARHLAEMKEARWATQEQRDKHIKLHKELHKGNKYHYNNNITFNIILENLDLTLTALGKKIGASRTTLLKRCKEFGYNSIKEVKSKYNHKVISVAFLGYEDVYDIEVPQTSNFALGAGIFVHNSKDFRQVIEKKGFRTDYVSVDRTTGPYDILKAAVYEERIDIYYSDILERELKQLELIKGTKVDHIPSGCFTGDTRIFLPDWSNISFEEAFAKYGKGEFKVFGNFQGGTYIVVARNCRITKRATELVRLTLNDQEIIECTPEHRFLLLNGTYKEAINLTKKDKIDSIKEPWQFIIKKEIIKKECDVWDLETETENFALATGVFVHNSKDVADAVAGVCWNIFENTPKSSVSVQTLAREEEPAHLTQHRIIREREKYYERVELQAQKQLEMEARIELIQRSIEQKRRGF